MKNRSVDRYFDDHAIGYNSGYEKIDDLRSFIFDERREIVFAMLDQNHGKVLDVGCGPAVYTEKLSLAGFNIYGVDVSSRMIEIAKNKNIHNAEFSVGRAEKLNFADDFFDTALCVGVLEYVNDTGTVIREIARVIKKGGTAIFTVPNRSSLLNKLDLLIRNSIKAVYRITRISKVKSSIDYDYEVKYFYPKELNSLLEKNGLVLEKRKFHIFRISFLNKIFPGASLFIAKKLNFITSQFLGINYIIKCRKK